MGDHPTTGADRSGDDRRPRRVYGVGTDPDPRFTLANERTLLAWLRTALAFVVTGVAAVALEDLIDQPVLVTIVAAVASGVGAPVALVAHRRWQNIERALRLGQPLTAPRPAVFLVLVVTALAVCAFVVLTWSLR